MCHYTVHLLVIYVLSYPYPSVISYIPNRYVQAILIVGHVFSKRDTAL